MDILGLLLSPPLLLLYLFAGCGTYVHLRGRVRHRLGRQLTDHSVLIAPYNCLMYLFSAVPATPILDRRGFPELDVLRDNWETIRDEARALLEGRHIRAAAGYNDIAFNSFFKRGWTRFYLKWYDAPPPSARELAPRTVELIEGIPSVNAALFAMLEPRSRLGAHRDPFGGSLRYHLGLITPDSEACRITVDGHDYVWHDGDDVVFDETFIHSAVNDTDEPRIILFCDVTRPLRTRLVRALNRFMIRHVVKASKTQNAADEAVGVLNRLSSSVYRVKLWLVDLKKANRFAYYALKYAIILVLLTILAGAALLFA